MGHTSEVPYLSEDGYYQGGSNPLLQPLLSALGQNTLLWVQRQWHIHKGTAITKH